MSEVAPLKKSAYLTGVSGRAFDAGSRTSVELGAWNPSLRSPDGAMLGERWTIDARTRDMVRNSGWTQAAIARKLDNVLGPNVRVQSTPDSEALGITHDQARDLGKKIQAEWRLYTRDPGKYVDAGRRLNFGGIARVLFWHWIVDGRCLALPLNLPRRGGRYATAFMLVDPVRLSNPYSMPNSYKLRDGIEIDQYGAPVAYNIRNAHPGDMLLADPTKMFLWTRVPAETSWGRRRVIHWFDQQQAEQSNGMSKLVAVLKKLRMLETRDDLELQNAAIKATFAAFITSALPADTMFKALTEAPTGEDNASLTQLEEYAAFQNTFYEQRDYQLNGTRLGHLLPGEKFETVKPDGPGGDFEVSQRVFLRHVASALDLTYEQLSFDWSQVNYSSARAALNEAWKSTTAALELFSDGVLTPMFDCWLEEAIATGRVVLPAGAPSFYEARAAYCSLIWTGPGRGYIDPLKEKKAVEIGLASGQDTLQDILAEDGRSPEDHFAQLAVEKELAASYGIPWPPTPLPAISNGGEAPIGSEQDAPPGGGAANGKTGGQE